MIYRVLWMSAALLCLVSASRASERPRAVLELFTSQGCASCPPADGLLAAYAQDPDIIALTYSVTIWDYLGWRDTLARAENTQRQRAYAAARGDAKLYTPEVVIDGIFHAVGSDKVEIEKKLAVPQDSRALRVPIAIKNNKDTVDISIAAWPYDNDTPRARVYLISYAKEKNVPVRSGENAGRIAGYVNVVENIQEIGYWNGAALDLRLFWRPAASQGGVVLLQNISHAGPGVIYGAATLP